MTDDINARVQRARNEYTSLRNVTISGNVQKLANLPERCRPEELAPVLAEANAAADTLHRLQEQHSEAVHKAQEATAAFISANERYVEDGAHGAPPKRTAMDAAEKAKEDAAMRVEQARDHAGRKATVALDALKAVRDAWYADLTDEAREAYGKAVEAARAAQDAVSAYYAVCQDAATVADFPAPATPNMAAVVDQHAAYPKFDRMPVPLAEYRYLAASLANQSWNGGMTMEAQAKLAEAMRPEFQNMNTANLRPSPDGLYRFQQLPGQTFSPKDIGQGVQQPTDDDAAYQASLRDWNK